MKFNLNDFLKRMFNTDIGMDLGTANTLVYVAWKGIVLEEPSVVAIDERTGKVVEVGHEAKKMLETAPGFIKVERPLRNGVIANFEAAQAMIKAFLRRVLPSFVVVRPRVVVGVPSGITNVEKRAVEEAVDQAVGAREIHLVEEARLAALGAGLPIKEPAGNMVVDIGGGTTEIVVLSMGDVVEAKSLRVGGDEIDQAIINYLKKNKNLLIGTRTAEEAKIKIGNVYPKPEWDSASMLVRGRNIQTQLPEEVELKAPEVREALLPTVEKIAESVKETLEKIQPQLLADIMARGIVLTGGGSLLKGLDEYLSEQTRVPVIVAEDPLRAVVKGAGKYLDFIRTYSSS